MAELAHHRALRAEVFDETEFYPMTEVSRQQFCAAICTSGSSVRSLDRLGMPFLAVGARMKRYNLDECKACLRGHFGGSHEPLPVVEYVAPLTPPRKKPRKLRVYPS